MVEQFLSYFYIFSTIVGFLLIFLVGNSKFSKSLRAKMTFQDKTLVYITVAIVLLGELFLVLLLNRGIVNKVYGIMIFCVYPLVVIIFSSLFYYLVKNIKERHLLLLVILDVAKASLCYGRLLRWIKKKRATI